MNVLVALSVTLPLAAAALLAMGERHLPRWLTDLCALLASGVSTCLAALLFLVARGQMVVEWWGDFAVRAGSVIGIDFAIDPAGAALMLLTSVLTFASLAFSAGYFDTVGARFHALMLLFLAAMSGFVLSGDLFNMFVFFALMTVSAVSLCGYKTEATGPVQGALNFGMVNSVGAVFILFGLTLLYGRAGAFNLAALGRALGAQPDPLVLVAFGLVTAGFLIKAAIAPFHFWLADAHAVAPTPVCVLFSGSMVELGLYGVARLLWTAFASPLGTSFPALRWALVVAGCATALLGAVMALGQRHLKRLLAYSTVSHAGIMLTALGLLDQEGTAALLVYVLGHGLVKGALFLCAGMLLHRFGTVDELELRGRGKAEPAVAIVYFVSALGLAGLAPFLTHVADGILHRHATDLGFGWTSVVVVAAAASTTGAVLRTGGRVFLDLGRRHVHRQGAWIGEERETKRSRNVPWRMIVPAALLALLALITGALPGLEQLAGSVAEEFVASARYGSIVLGGDLGAPLPVVAHTRETSTLFSLTGASLGILVAALGLWPPRLQRGLGRVLSRLGSTLMRSLHRVHDGHMGSYLALVTAGTALWLFALLAVGR